MVLTVGIEVTFIEKTGTRGRRQALSSWLDESPYLVRIGVRLYRWRRVDTRLFDFKVEGFKDQGSRRLKADEQAP